MSDGSSEAVHLGVPIRELLTQGSSVRDSRTSVRKLCTKGHQTAYLPLRDRDSSNWA